MVSAEVTSSGELSFEGQIVGRLQGFRFTPEANLDADRARPDDSDIASALVQEFEVRANRFSEAIDGALVLANDGAIRWLGDPVAKIAAGDKLLAPRALILADESSTESARQKIQTRVDLWLAAYIQRLLGPLFELEAATGLEGPARNVAVQLAEAQGVLERGRVAHDVKTLDQNARGALRKLGVRFGAYYIYIPALVKPAIRVLATQLWALRQTGAGAGAGLDEIPQLAASGRTSFLADSAIPKETYRVAGFRLCGDRAVRVDIVERLADLIRPAVAYRPGPNAGAPPPGAADGDGFIVTGAMTSLTGCAGEQFASVLRSLGFASHFVKGPALTAVAPQTAPTSAQLETVGDAEAAPETSAIQSLEAEVSGENEAPPVGDPESRPSESVTDAQEESAAREGQTAGASGEDGPHVAGGSAPSASESQTAAEARGGQENPSVGDSAIGEGGAAQDEVAASGADADIPAVAISDGKNVAETAAPTEEVLIEVWRPRPPAHRQRHSRPASRDNSSTRANAAADSEERPDGRGGASEKMRRRRHRPPQISAPQAGAEANLPLQNSGEEPNRPRHERGPRRPFDPAHKSEGGAGRRGGASRSGGKDERKQDERRRENTPAPMPRREPPIDLNSPFAKLLALKSQLEAKNKG
jgi:ATP-dependent RNA helicase SUPV3L1/SUV3